MHVLLSISSKCRDEKQSQMRPSLHCLVFNRSTTQPLGEIDNVKK